MVYVNSYPKRFKIFVRGLDSLMNDFKEKYLECSYIYSSLNDKLYFVFCILSESTPLIRIVL